MLVTAISFELLVAIQPLILMNLNAHMVSNGVSHRSQRPHPHRLNKGSHVNVEPDLEFYGISLMAAHSAICIISSCSYIGLSSDLFPSFNGCSVHLFSMQNLFRPSVWGCVLLVDSQRFDSILTSQFMWCRLPFTLNGNVFNDFECSRSDY